MLLAFLAATALVLNSQGKLVPIGSVIFSPDGYTSPTVDSAGTFAVAFFLYLLIISFLDSTETEYLTGLIVLGGLMYNAKTKGANGVLPVLFGKAADLTSNPFAGATATGSGSVTGNGTPGVFNPFGGGIQITPTGQ